MQAQHDDGRSMTATSFAIRLTVVDRVYDRWADADRKLIEAKRDCHTKAPQHATVHCLISLIRHIDWTTVSYRSHAPQLPPFIY